VRKGFPTFDCGTIRGRDSSIERSRVGDMKPRKFKDERLQRIWDAAYGSGFASAFYYQLDVVRQANREGMKLNDSVGGILENAAEQLTGEALMIADAAIKNLDERSDYEDE
jgi:hypothetical protein